MSTSTSELEAPTAYEAARDRALRTTEALILAEGQVRQLERKLAEVTAERDQYATEAGKARAARARRRLRDRARRARKADPFDPDFKRCPGCGEMANGGHRAQCEGVKDAAEDSDPDPDGYTHAIGQAD